VQLRWIALFSAALCFGQDYDLVLRGGHVIDAKNGIDGVRDVAVRAGRIAAVAEKLDASRAKRTVDVRGLYVTPGLIDIHTHVYAGTGERSSYAGDNSVYPDGFTFRVGVTTVVDAGCSGWRNFPDFQDRVIKRSKTRVLAMLNIVGNGMRGPKFENKTEDMDADAAAKCALENKDVVVGIKTAHYAGPEWVAVDRAVQAGTKAKIPVMVDFGTNHPDSRPLRQLLTEKLRPGDIYTHMYSGLRNELLQTGQPNPGLIEGQRRGVILDVGHGGGSFLWSIAVPLTKAGVWPDSISTDLHIGSMNAGMKDQLNVMSKMLLLGMPLRSVIAAATWNPAREIRREALGNLSVGAPADIAVLRLEKGEFGFVDHGGNRMKGDQKFVCEVTLREGAVVYDLNGLTKDDWDAHPGK
jgi:dihydroorotase